MPSKLNLPLLAPTALALVWPYLFSVPIPVALSIISLKSLFKSLTSGFP